MRRVVSLSLFLFVTASGALRPHVLAQAPSVFGFDRLFDLSTGIVRDTNGDGLADAIAARVIVADKPSIEDMQVATNIAGRLGFETMAMTLPLVLRASEPHTNQAWLPIVVGKSNPDAALLMKMAIDPATLEKGQGVLAIVASSSGPQVLVSGADDAGTLAAGNVLAAYLPRLWGSSGARLDTVAADVKKYLLSRAVRISNASIITIVVDSDRRGLKSIRVVVALAPAGVLRATAALESLNADHRAGKSAATLNYANVAETIVELRPAAGEPMSVSVKRSGLNTRALTPPDDPLPPPVAPATANASTPAEVVTFDLANIFTIDGLLGDSYPDLIADRVDSTIFLGSSPDNLGAAHIAARLGLESTGISLPIARKADEVPDLSRETNPILVGRDNQHVETLVKIGKLRLDDLGPREGAVEVVPRAFGSVTATVVAGADAVGADAAANYLARRAPYLWSNNRGAFSLEHLETQVANVFGAKTSGGQAAMAVSAVDEVIKSLADKTVESFDAKVFLEEKSPAFDQLLNARMKGRLPAATVTASSEAITAPSTVFEETQVFQWEVQDFRDRFKADVLPRVARGSAVTMDVRLSESPELRADLAKEVRQALTAAGAATADVRIRSAYKQGFLWMSEEVLPALKLQGKNVASIHVKVAEFRPDFTKKYRFYQVPTRWLHELYPIDEVMKRDLGLPVSAFSMELVTVPANGPTYDVDAKDKAGKSVYHATFSPKHVEREYLDKFPGWSRVDVTTGWLNATVNGQMIQDVRIATDPERFWDYYQSKVLTRIYDHVMKLTNNRPTTDAQPFHRDLDIELWMSEPDFRIGVDEEQVSSLESLHEDLYFVTLDFYNAMGRNAPGRPRLSAPGKIFPIIHPERRGQAGEARVLYAANASPRGRVDITYQEKGVDKPTKVTRDLLPVAVGAPAVRRAVVTSDRVREFRVDLAPTTDTEAGRAVDLIDRLAEFHTAGLFTRELSYAHVDGIAFSFALRDAKARRVLPFTGEEPASLVRAGGMPAKGQIVAWDHVIGPDEAESLVKALGAFPAIKAYRAGQSYRGRDVSVMEITLPTTSEQISVTKYTAYKPTIFITGRQHANEVSSTSHILRLAERLATDPQYAAMLKKINVILHPVENPDGAAMAYELQKLTPTHMLHAGRYSALGQDVGGASALLPESQVRGRVWREWLPDIYLNPHGYPSHEWVQQFAGYVPPGFRQYLSSRGWYTQLTGLRDPRYPEISSATDALRDSIAGALTADPKIKALNLAHQDRYRRWAFGFAPFVYGQEIYEDTAIYYTDPETGEPRGSRRAPAAQRGDVPLSRQTMGQWPQVTFNSGMTEAPDETAQGVWLGLVTEMGFSFLQAHLEFLEHGTFTRDLIEEGAARDGVTRTWVRTRPVTSSKVPAFKGSKVP